MFTIEIKKPGLKQLTITSLPDKTEYYQEELLKINGLEVKGTYEDGTTKKEFILLTNIVGFDNKTIGEQNLTITKDSISVNFIVNVSRLEIESIYIENEPTIKSYAIGEDLNINGLIVRGYYNNDTNKILTISKSDIIGFDNKILGEQKLIVKIGDLTDDFDIEVRELESINIDSSPLKTEYYKNETLDITGLTVELNYTDNSSYIRKLTTAEESNIIGFNNTKIGNQEILINISNKLTTFEIEILDVYVEKLNIIEYPTKTVYLLNEPLELTGLIVNAEYSNNTSQKINIENKVYGFNSATIGVKELIIRMGTLQTSFNVLVSKEDEIKLKLIDIKIDPTSTYKTGYLKNESLNILGLKILGIYEKEDKSTIERNLPISLNNISNFD